MRPRNRHSHQSARLLASECYFVNGIGPDRLQADSALRVFEIESSDIGLELFQGKATWLLAINGLRQR